MSDVRLDPDLFESLEAGDSARLERWLVAEGEHVRAGQVVAQADLAQQRVEIAARHAGVIEQMAVAPGETFRPGSVLATLIEF